MSGIKGLLLVIMAVFFVSPSTWAQQSSSRTVKRNVATVLFSTLGGAVLGLSTLSFYGEPQEHTDNISVGALIGFVAGSGYVAYSATKPEVVPKNDYGFGEGFEKNKKAFTYAKALPLVQLNFDF